MLQLLLVYLAIGVVCCETNNCPIFSSFENKVSLFNELQGTFLKIFAIGVSPVAPCQKQTFTIGPNNIINNGYFQSPDWCLRLNNCTSNSEYQECDLTALTPVRPGTLPSPERNKIKLAGKIGKGDGLCLLYSYCRISEEGMYVLCRKQPKSVFTRLLAFFELLSNSLVSISPSPVPHLTIVNQTNCTFVNSCPP